MITLVALFALSAPPELPELYTPARAVADALYGPLEYVGRGPWFGMAHWESCVYRNEKVIVVDIYCAKQWPQAFSLRIFSPKRGRARFHVESERDITTIGREDYVDNLWQIESEPPPSRDALPVSVTLGMSFDDIRDYEEARYQLYLPACYTAGGGARCHEKLSAARGAWEAAVMPFWRAPGRNWRELIQRVRKLAEKHGT